MGHRKWSRHYGIENNITIVLSFSLVFVLMIYVYPLRLIFSALFAWISGGFFLSEFTITSISELTSLLAFYGFGFATISILLGLLFLHVQKTKDEIILDEVKILLTKL